MMLQLEALRQQIEALEIEAGSLSDCLDRGQSASLRMPNPRARIEECMSLAKQLKKDLHTRLTHLRSHNPQAIEDWVNLHTTALQKIASEPRTDANTATRRWVAAQTIEAWQLVRTGEKFYVSTNWHYLADHQQAMRKLVPPPI